MPNNTEIVTTYFHINKYTLLDQLAEDEIELTEEAKEKLRYFGYEHSITAVIDTVTGESKIIMLDGRDIEND